MGGSVNHVAGPAYESGPLERPSHQQKLKGVSSSSVAKCGVSLLCLINQGVLNSLFLLSHLLPFRQKQKLFVKVRFVNMSTNLKFRAKPRWDQAPQ